MRHLILGVLAIVIGTTATATGRQPADPDIWVSIASQTPAGGVATVRAMQPAIYIEGPGAGIGVPATSGSLWFTIKAWKEDGHARVVVSARLDDRRAPGGFTETPISTVRISPGESIEVAESQQWGGPRLMLRGFLR